MGKRWNLDDVEKLVSAGKVKIGDGFFQEKKDKPKPISFPAVPKGKQFIEFTLVSKNIFFKKEKLFVPGRKWSADYFVPELNLLIEYEGIYSKKSRHTFFKGYSADVEKYNKASLLGYKLLRYTADNYNNFRDDLEFLLENKNNDK